MHFSGQEGTSSFYIYRVQVTSIFVLQTCLEINLSM